MTEARVRSAGKRKREDLTETLKSTSIGSYLSALTTRPPLKHLELVDLFKKLDEKTIPDEEALKIRQQLCERNLRLVIAIVKQYKHVKDVPIEDLVQEGNIGLMKAVDKFEWKKGYKFSTYASWWIRQAIGQHLMKKRRLIRLPAHAAMIQKRMIKATEEYKDLHGQEPTADDLVEALGESETVIKATFHSGKGIVSLQSSNNDREHNENNTLNHKIPDDGPQADPFGTCSDKQVLEVVMGVLRSLSPKEEAIIRLRFGLYDDKADPTDYPITEHEMSLLEKGHGMT